MNILVTGALGFIGSHTVVELIQGDHGVVIADNLANAKMQVLDQIQKITDVMPTFYKVDVTQEAKLEEIFKSHKIDGVLHFAGLKAVGESVTQPLEYYFNNLVSTMVVSKMCLRYGVHKFVFSSSATVYGDQPSPLSEDLPLMKTTNPYGETKAISERILTDTAAVNPDFSVTLLRYFNPVGAHQSGLIGEDPNGLPNNLVPFVSKVAKGTLPKLNIFGDDYDTRDGTGVRDYIHVVDLAKGHVAAIEKIDKGVNIYNLGTGKGTSVLELVHAFMKVNAVNIPYEIVARRPGDLASCYSEASKAERELDWKATLTLEDMVRDAWRFEQGQA